MKTIKAQIMLVILTLVLFACVMFGVTSCVLNYNTANELLKQTLTETATVAAGHVAAEIKAIKNIAIETGCTSELASTMTAVDAKKKLMEQRAKNYGFLRGNLLDKKGVSYFDGNDYSSRDYFQAAMRGEAYISDPTISKITGKTTFLISAPLWSQGTMGTEIIGAVYYAPDENFLNNIVSGINVSKTGYAYIINSAGVTVADITPENVGVENSIEESKTDSTLTELADMETKMLRGESGFGSYSYKGEYWVQGYAPIENTNGWSIGVAAQQSDFMGNFYLSIIITGVLIVLFAVAGIVTAIVFANKLGRPLQESSKRLSLLADGNLSAPAADSKRKDEVGVIANSIQIVVERMNGVVQDISHMLGEMADGNFDVQSTMVYSGDFAPIQEAMTRIVGSLNDAMQQIGQSSDQVSSGSEQVSSGAQALSQGATEQASSIEELSATIAEISKQIKQNAENASDASKISAQVGEKLSSGNKEMKQMLTAMEEIKQASRRIGDIIKTINDIAFQTNILALNAAVEAARAGAAGKGFAVVADEVRNLAVKSADASKATTALIENSIKAVENGSHIADSTAKTLVEVMNETAHAIELVNKIAEASMEQAQSVTQITQGVEQVSAVVQTNSATAEESAAASEELSGQAHLLKELLSHFKVRESRTETIGFAETAHHSPKEPRREITAGESKY